MANFDGIFELDITYTTQPVGMTELLHHMTMDVNVDGDSFGVGDTFDNIVVFQRNGLDSDLKIWTDTMITLIKPFFPAATNFGEAFLWKIPEGTFDKQFMSSYEIGVVGTSGVASTPAHQVTFTFRSVGGGTARIQLMESSLNSNARTLPPFTGASLNLTNQLKSAATIMQARDNTFIIGNIARNEGQNEKLWRKRYRS